MTAPTLGAAEVAFVESGISISVATVGADGVATLSRALGARVADGRRVTLYVDALQAHAVLEAVDRNRAVAAAFSEPGTNRTVQLKGRDARRVAADASAAALCRDHTKLFEDCLVRIGYRPEMPAALLRVAPERLVGIAFTIDEAYTQTPGPRAGRPLAGGPA